MILLLLALGCDGGQSAAPAPVPEAAPTPPTTVAASVATPTVWKADNIDQLVPVAPSRKTTVSRPIPGGEKYDAALQALGTVVEK